MSGGQLTSAAQVRYLLQWFSEWSELQRQDFLPLLVDKMASVSDVDQLAETMATVNCAAKPMSLFQCRIKLFNEWYPTWDEEECARLVRGISDADPAFGERLAAAMQATHNGHNGHDQHNTPHIEPETPTTDDHAAEPHNDEENVPEPVHDNMMPLEIAATS